MDICVLEHEEDAPPALLADWATERRHSVNVLRVPQLGSWPRAADYDAVVSLGSDCSVHATDEEWIARETSFLRDAHDSGVPILGICFGAQALAKALGGEVSRASRVEAGWSAVASSAPALISPGPWFRWHEDVFSLPPGARELARNDIGVLGFVVGASVGLQFHPEVDRALADRWVAPNGSRLLAQGIDHDALRREIGREAVGARERAYGLFDQIAEHWSTGGGALAPSERG